MVHIVHQPFQAEGLRHLHAWHGVPKRNCENLFFQICLLHFPSAKIFWIFSNHLLSILLAKKRIGSRLAWMSGCCRKKLQPHFVQKSRFLQFPAKTDTKPSASDINLVLQHLQQHVQLVLGHHHPQPVAGVHHEDDALQGGHVKGHEGEEEHTWQSL